MKETITTENVDKLIQEYREKVPRQFTTQLECIKFIMYFKILHNAEFCVTGNKFIQYDDVILFDKLSDIKLRPLQLICHMVKDYVNDGAYLAAIDYIKDIYNS